MKTISSDKLPVLGAWLPNRPLQVTPTSFRNFRSETGIHGMAKVVGSTLELLVFAATKPSAGQFRTFISQCKENYELIRIWAVMNNDLPPILRRYGFVEGFDTDEYGEVQDVWEWNRKTFSPPDTFP